MKVLSEKSLTEIQSSSLPVYYYGVCEYADYAAEGAKVIGLKVDGIFDTNSDTNLDRTYSFPRLPQADLPIVDKNAVFIITCSHFYSVERHLNTHGFYNIFDACLLIDLFLRNAKLSEVERIMASRALAALSEKRNHITKQFSNLTIPSLDLILTEKCTLKCTDCANLMPYFKTPKDSDLEVMLKSLEQILDNSDRLEELRILGGEPFLFKSIDTVISYASSLEKIGRIIIYTNGTIVPRANVLELLGNKKVLLEITNYGDLSKNFAKLLSTCDQLKINYVVRELPETWDDSSNIDEPLRRPEEDQFIFEECCAKYLYTLMHGKLYRCPFSASLDALKFVNLDDSNHLTIFQNKNFSRSTLQQFIYRTSFYDSCRYCQGRSKVLSRVQPARQSAQKREPFKRIPIIALKV